MVSAAQCRSDGNKLSHVFPGQVLIASNGRMHFPQRSLKQVEEILCVCAGIHGEHSFFSHLRVWMEEAFIYSQWKMKETAQALQNGEGKVLSFTA